MYFDVSVILVIVLMASNLMDSAPAPSGYIKYLFQVQMIFSSGSHTISVKILYYPNNSGI